MRGTLLILTAIVLCMPSTSGIMAQTDSIKPGIIKALGNKLDTKAFTKYDPLYIDVPESPWRVILRGKMDENKIDLNSTNTWLLEGYKCNMDMTMNFDSEINKSIGVWVGYRGIGAAYFFKPGKKPGINIALSATAAKFGINFRFRDMQIDKLHLKTEMSYGDSTQVEEDDYTFRNPINIRSLFLNGYYVFNGKRYSQGAAYNQVVIQRRSAGSFLLGVTAYASQVELNTSSRNAGVILAMTDSVGSITLGKISVGLGYGYNWVPARGWTVNAMGMANLSVSDNIIRSLYDSNYDFLGNETEQSVEDYGTWDKENRRWQNGKTHKPMRFNNESVNWDNDIDMWQVKEESSRTRWAFNLDFRVGVAYCWKRYFVSVNGIFTHFNYGHENNKVDVLDWYAIASLGIRL